jgi:hypothetical protein
LKGRLMAKKYVGKSSVILALVIWLSLTAFAASADAASLQSGDHIMAHLTASDPNHSYAFGAHTSESSLLVVESGYTDWGPVIRLVNTATGEPVLMTSEATTSFCVLLRPGDESYMLYVDYGDSTVDLPYRMMMWTSATSDFNCMNDDAMDMFRTAVDAGWTMSVSGQMGADNTSVQGANGAINDSDSGNPVTDGTAPDNPQIVAPPTGQDEPDVADGGELDIDLPVVGDIDEIVDDVVGGVIPGGLGAVVPDQVNTIVNGLGIDVDGHLDGNPVTEDINVTTGSDGLIDIDLDLDGTHGPDDDDDLIDIDLGGEPDDGSIIDVDLPLIGGNGG